eukprot:Rmarinus@m.16398
MTEEGRVSNEKLSGGAPKDEPYFFSDIPDPCCICLARIQPYEFSLLDGCFHGFCRSCIMKWSSINPKCPLCKSPFTSIIHSIRSESDFDRSFLDSQPRQLKQLRRTGRVAEDRSPSPYESPRAVADVDSDPEVILLDILEPPVSRSHSHVSPPRRRRRVDDNGASERGRERDRAGRGESGEGRENSLGSCVEG